MQTQIDIILTPLQASDERLYMPLLAARLGVKEDEITCARVIRRSIDARKKSIKVNLRFVVACGEPATPLAPRAFDYPDVSLAPEVAIVGAGPAGLFAALRLIELGFKPVIFERGKKVSERKTDIAAVNKKHLVNEDSNYCFGEGGAGTFSDGKLYTRSNKRGDISKILEVLHLHGASGDILIDAHPHIGTDRLPSIITRMRGTIEAAGGSIFFESRVTDLIIKDGRVSGIETNSGERFGAAAVILATGHSARDIYQLLHGKNILIEAKPYAMGVRVEHPQGLIDRIQYHGTPRQGLLPAASYGLAAQVDGRGVYSFCMCPGGIIVPASTAGNEVVVNGMSSSGRNSPYANSGIVVEVRQEDFKEYESFGPLAGLKFQQALEQAAFDQGGGELRAPAQRLADFVSARPSSSLPVSSYHPGLSASALHRWLPPAIAGRLQGGFRAFENKMRGFLTNDAVILGVESRTSTPVKVPRDNATFEHLQIKGLYPCGEGAGYAGGIVSSAIDGENCAQHVAYALR